MSYLCGNLITMCKAQETFQYIVFDSMGRKTDIAYFAANQKEAFNMFKSDKVNFSKYYYGKLQRQYQRGYHISLDKK